MNESIESITNWATYYFTSTHPISCYPVPETTIALMDISKLPHLGKTSLLNSNEQQMIREWGVQHGKSVRQRTVRQETTKFKAGTLPLNMYRSSPLDYPKGKVYLFQAEEQEEAMSTQKVQGEETEQQEEDKEVCTSPQGEVEDEYDTVEQDDDDASLHLWEQ